MDTLSVAELSLSIKSLIILITKLVFTRIKNFIIFLFYIIPVTFANAGTPLPGQIIVHPTNSSWLQYSDGSPFFLASPGDPEDFLYRGNLNTDGTRNGDQITLLNKLKTTGANGIYMQAIRSHGGDGNATHNPFVDNDPTKALSNNTLNQWETWFDDMDANGIVIYFFFYDDGARIWNTGNSVGAEERAFFENIVNRFEQYKNLIWVVAEEYGEAYTSQRISNLAEIIRNADDHDHVIGVHKNNGLSFTEFENDPNIDQFAMQYNVTTAGALHNGMIDAWNRASGRFNLNMSEAGSWGSGSTARKKAWATAMGGAYVMVLGMDILNTPLSDLEDLGRLNQFMQSIDYYNMVPHDELSFAGTQYVIAQPGVSYVAYASDLGNSELGLKSMSGGTYRLQWFDVVSGNTVIQDNLNVVGGDVSWPTPNGIGNELAVYIQQTSSNGQNIVPTGQPQILTTPQDTDTNITLTHSDPDGPGAYTYTILTSPSNGALTGSGNTYSYSPAAGFIGNDSFTFKVNDGLDDSLSAIISINIISTTNVAPVAQNQNYFTSFETPILISLTYNDIDGPGPYTVNILSQSSNGALSGTGNDILYTPNNGFSGSDLFSWIVNDGELDSTPGTIDITVGPQPIIGNIAIQNTTPVNYEWDVLDIGKMVYIDRGFTFNTIPSEFIGLDYLKTANDDKASSGNGFITFDVDKPVTVFVGHVEDELNIPTWLSDWNFTNKSIETSDRDFFIYQKSFNAGTITLDGNESPNKSMYTVFIAEINDPNPAPIDPDPTSNNNSPRGSENGGAFSYIQLILFSFLLIASSRRMRNNNHTSRL